MCSSDLWSDVTALPNASSLASISTIAQVMILQRVNVEFDIDNLDGEDGPLTKSARCYLAAHLALTLRPTPAAGALTEEHEGDLGATYAVTPIPTGAWWYATTGYGRALWQIIESSLSRLPWVL